MGKITIIVGLMVLGSGVAKADEINQSQFSHMLCELQNKVRWQTEAWTPTFCDMVSKEILKVSKETDISPELIVGVILNESEMKINALRSISKEGKLYAQDGGLMGLHCVLGEKGKCTNGFVRGLTVKQMMDPVTNIRIGAKILSYTKNEVACPHTNHGWWVHYNHGPTYIDRGPARHYAHRVAVLVYAVAAALGRDVPEDLRGPITMKDKGQKPREIDKPIGKRQRELYAKVLSCKPSPTMM